jgi:hypothetical protein
MMNINIYNCATLAKQPFIRYRMHSTSRNTIEYTESTRLAPSKQPIDAGVMAWWSNHAKSISVSSNQHTNTRIQCLK